MRGISFTKPDSHELALWFAHSISYSDSFRYNNSGELGWTPEGARQHISEMQQRLARMADKNNIAILNNTVKIERIRLSFWENFSPEEMSFVSNPFPLVYGIPYKFAQEFIPQFKDLEYPGEEDSGEVFIEGKIDTPKLNIFTPANKIKTVQEYLKSKGLASVQILDLNVYRFLVELYLYLYPQEEWGPKLEKRFKTRFKGPHDFIDALKRHQSDMPFLEK